jgi:hypothetical protein
LPEAATVLQRVIERSHKDGDNDRLFEQRYSFTRTESMEIRNSKGVLKKNESHATHHVAGAAEPADPKKPAGKSGSTRAGKDRKGESESPELDGALLKRFQFKVVGREQVAGRSALKLVFNPAPDAPAASSLPDRVMARITGEAWVDEADYALTKVSFQLTEPVNIWAGIAGSLRTFSFQSESARTAEGLWYERLTTWHLEAREFLVNETMDGKQETAVDPAAPLETGHRTPEAANQQPLSAAGTPGVN